MANYLDRIQEYIDYKGLSNRAFEGSIDVSHGLIARNLKVNGDLGGGVVENILKIYPEINPDWLMCGNPPMLRTNIGKPITNEEIQKLKGKIDILEEMLVKANEKLAKVLMEKQDLENQLKNKKSA
jgi:hypothetical protein